MRLLADSKGMLAEGDKVLLLLLLFCGGLWLFGGEDSPPPPPPPPTATAVGLVLFLPMAMAIFFAIFFFADLLLPLLLPEASALVIISGVERMMMPRRGLQLLLVMEVEVEVERGGGKGIGGATSRGGEAEEAVVVVGEPAAVELLSPGGVDTVNVLRLLSRALVHVAEALSFCCCFDLF